MYIFGSSSLQQSFFCLQHFCYISKLFYIYSFQIQIFRFPKSLNCSKYFSFTFKQSWKFLFPFILMQSLLGSPMLKYHSVLFIALFLNPNMPQNPILKPHEPRIFFITSICLPVVFITSIFLTKIYFVSTHS